MHANKNKLCSVEAVLLSGVVFIENEGVEYFLFSLPFNDCMTTKKK